MATRAPRTPSPHTSNSSFEVPGTPRWGPRYDDHDSTVARRSRRSTKNPFSTANNGKARTPEPRAMRDDMMLSPPASPSTRASLMTPRSMKSKKTARFAPDKLNAPSAALMLTPVKTPRHITPPSTGTARRVVFQHGDPSDAMPTPRKMKTGARRGSPEIFSRARGERFEILPDSNAQRPVLDLSEDNAFIGKRSRPQEQHGRTRTTTPRPLTAEMTDEEMKVRVENDEGLIYKFRRKNIFRPYDDTHTDIDQVMTLGYKPIKRSKDRPRLLDFGRLAPAHTDTDEEAVTDIEAGDDEQGVDFTFTSSQGSVSAGHHASFASWPRTKPGAAKSARKREMDEHASASGTAKKAKNMV